ncbi:NAD(P)-dependent oxidoreductase [Labilibaculum sp. K2S]|uniref:NAD(P)-dependent oxidoreductase n=1 Tax=Labilibaculum sp. K2S TaxID=3056386 RepID=UPI003FA5FDA0
MRSIRYGNTDITCLSIKGLDRKVIAYDKFDSQDEFCEGRIMEDLFEQCDIMSLHVPQAEKTMLMVNDEFLNKFKKPIYLINNVRGKVVRIAYLVKNPVLVRRKVLVYLI